MICFKKLACLLLLSFALGQAPLASAWTNGNKPLSVVRVNVTSQPYDFLRPWMKKTPVTLRAVGAVLQNKRILVTGEMVADATLIELEHPRTGQKTAATVACVDYEANLALLKPADEKFLGSLKPLELTSAAVGDKVSMWQVEPNGELLATAGLVTAVETTRYPIADSVLMVYRLTSAMQPRENSFTVPAVKNGKLAGMLWSFDGRTQNVQVIPHPVIEHFLKAAAKPEYRGFPRGGFAFCPTHDPQLRRYAGLDDKTTVGVYITSVQKDWPADRAGLRTGDVLMAIDDFIVDRDGNYTDPAYGKISLGHLLSTRHFDGDTVKLKIIRYGRAESLDLTLRHRAASENTIPPFLIDQAPRFAVVGGLLLTELSRPYLKEWGAEWWRKAPPRLVHYERNQGELFPNDHRRIVILSQVLPTPDTIGYEDLRFLVVTKVNGASARDIASVLEALKKPINGFHKIEFQDDPKEIYLDAKQVAANEAAVLRTYGLSASRR